MKTKTQDLDLEYYMGKLEPEYESRGQEAIGHLLDEYRRISYLTTQNHKHVNVLVVLPRTVLADIVFYLDSHYPGKIEGHRLLRFSKHYGHPRPPLFERRHQLSALLYDSNRT